MPLQHTHNCKQCDSRYECNGELLENYDGFPEVICHEYHELDLRLCEDCIDELVDRAERQKEHG